MLNHSLCCILFCKTALHFSEIFETGEFGRESSKRYGDSGAEREESSRMEHLRDASQLLGISLPNLCLVFCKSFVSFVFNERTSKISSIIILNRT